MNKDAEKVHLKDFDPIIDAESERMREALASEKRKCEAMTREEVQAYYAGRNAAAAEELAVLRRNFGREGHRPEYFGAGLDRKIKRKREGT